MYGNETSRLRRTNEGETKQMENAAGTNVHLYLCQRLRNWKPQPMDKTLLLIYGPSGIGYENVGAYYDL